MSSRPDLRLDWATHKAAAYACEHWHYSKGTPNQKLAKVGVWECGKFVGCVVFGSGANSNLFKPYALTQFQGCELVRVALAAHKSPVSRIVAIAMRILCQEFPGLRLLISFADPDYGHHGGIYQAGGWFYVGMTDPADEYLVKGVRMHGRALRSTRSTHKFGGTPASNILDWTRKIIDPRASLLQGSSKHRYLMPLDDEMRARVAPLAKPYPKRVKQATYAHPADGGGAAPTHTLQFAGLDDNRTKAEADPSQARHWKPRKATPQQSRAAAGAQAAERPAGA